MARVSGVDLPHGKKIGIALTYIFGIGRTAATKICEGAEVSVDSQADDLSEDELKRIRDFIDANYKVEGDLRREISMNIKRLMDLGCYRGLRHRKGLPVHGQRTHTNARTRKGPKHSVAAPHKPASK